ncbi:hypothetical protein [Caballeronia sp. GAFFF1]|uniref:hypothetical protein n=1 Tax=Caballeronia sp. GAFFF1 TaxID=2921779 RepID=UPI00202898E5|nr:hypothetical protein [Caballeronia sp. GAFFF1]
MSRESGLATVWVSLPKRSLAASLIPEAGRYAHAMSIPMSPAVAVELALSYHLILEALRTGFGNSDHLARMLQLTLKTMLVGASTGMTLEPTIFREAQEGIERCRRSRRDAGSWHLDHATYKCLCEVVAMFERQLAQAPFYEFMLADEQLQTLAARWVVEPAKHRPCERAYPLL